MRAFAVAFNVALGVIVIAWLHKPPLGYDLERDWWERLWTDPNATFAMFVAFFTFGLLGLGYMQFLDSRLLQRAYLSVEPLGISCRRNDLWYATVGFYNAGRLPARDVRWSINIERFSPEEDWTGMTTADANRKGPVVPAGATVRRASKAFSVDERFFRDPANRPALFMYVYGQVTYSDGFGTARFTKFCHRYNSRAIVLSDDGGFRVKPADGRYHDHGNDAT